MKKIIYAFVLLLLANFSLAAMTGDSGSKDSSSSQKNKTHGTQNEMF